MRFACLVCGAARMVEVLDLGMHPFADRFVPVDRSGEPDEFYPLVLDRCRECGHVQARHETNPDKRYADYSYVSGHSAFARAYWDDYAKDIVRRLDLGPSSLVVEAGSNDGYLCTAFKSLGLHVLGVDPSDEMVRLSQSSGIETRCGYFDSAAGCWVHEVSGRGADVVIANNVLNHADDLVRFMHGVAVATAGVGSHFVFQVPSWLRMVERRDFDSVYHEHVHYFSPRSIAHLLARCSMRAVDIVEVAQHGGSIRVIARRAPGEEEHVQIPEVTLDPAMPSEDEMNSLRREVLLRVLGHRAAHRDHKLVLAGASAKNNTWLVCHGLRRGLIDFVTDVSPSKVGKLTPGSRIPIVHERELAKYEKVSVLVPRNMRETIERNVLAVKPDAVILYPEG